jgi:hypothetical protein
VNVIISVVRCWRTIVFLLATLTERVIPAVKVEYTTLWNRSAIGTRLRNARMLLRMLGAARIISVITDIRAVLIVKFTTTLVGLLSFEVAVLAYSVVELTLHSTSTNGTVRRIVFVLETLHHSVMAHIAPAIRDMCLLGTVLLTAEVGTLVDRRVGIP